MHTWPRRNPERNIHRRKQIGKKHPPKNLQQDTCNRGNSPQPATGRNNLAVQRKGKKETCSNERGITLASNIGEVYKRIVNERVKQHVIITNAQACGIQGNPTVDHLIVLKQTVKEIIGIKQTAYVVFLDVQKAYDKAWLNVILYVLMKNGVEGKNLSIIKNSNLTAKIQTWFGLTKEIPIKDSIRQDGALSVVEYATLIDEISKELRKRAQGVTTAPGTKIDSLLWMDDVCLIHRDRDKLQQMLHITNQVAKKYHIEFEAAKCKVVTIGKGPSSKPTLNGQILEEVEAYKYLGEMINNKGNLSAHITELEKKIQAATQDIITETGNIELKGIRMEAVWQPVDSIIIPILTYGQAITLTSEIPTWLIKSPQCWKNWQLHLKKCRMNVWKRNALFLIIIYQFSVWTKRLKPRCNRWAKTGFVDNSSKFQLRHLRLWQVCVSYSPPLNKFLYNFNHAGMTGNVYNDSNSHQDGHFLLHCFIGRIFCNTESTAWFPLKTSCQSSSLWNWVPVCVILPRSQRASFWGVKLEETPNPILLSKMLCNLSWYHSKYVFRLVWICCYSTMINNDRSSTNISIIAQGSQLSCQPSIHECLIATWGLIQYKLWNL